MIYVIYDETGALVGKYIQDLQPQHENNYIEINEDIASRWLMYRANEARDGLELIPPAPPVPPTVEEITAQYSSMVQWEIESRARTMGYDNILTAVSYADEPAVAKYQTEGRALRRWRSLVWQHCQTLLAQVAAGQAEIPSEVDLIAGLPALVIDEPEEPAA